MNLRDRDNLQLKDKRPVPKVSFVRRFDCTTTFAPISGLQRKERQAVMVEVPGNSTSTVIGGLNPDLQYSVYTVSISTSEGAGAEATACGAK